MTHYVRVFTEAEDDLIREYASGAGARGTGRGLKSLAKLLRTGKDTILRRRAELLGEPAPQPRPEDISTRSITVGDDPLLKRLRKVHSERIK